MLVKDELTTLPVLPAPAKKPDKKRRYELYAAAAVHDLPRSGKVLAVDVYDDGLHLRCRFFSDNRNYIFHYEGLNFEAEGWSQRNPFGNGWYSRAKDTRSTKEGDSLVLDFLGEPSRWISETDKTVGGYIDAWIGSKNADKSRQEWDRKVAQWKEHSGMFPKLPQKLAAYCEEHIFRDTVIYYSKLDSKGKRRGRCVHCGKRFSVPRNQRSGAEGTCPKCGRPGVFRGDWTQAAREDKAEICIPYKVNGDLLLRYTKVLRSIDAERKKPSYSFEDVFYDLHLHRKNGAPVEYSYYYGNGGWGGPDWHRLKNDSGGRYGPSYVYTPQLEPVFGEQIYNVPTSLLRDQLDRLIRPLNFRRLLDNLKNTQQAEYLVKMGLPMIAASSDGFVQGVRSFKAVVGCGKEYLQVLRETQANRREACVIGRQNSHASPEDVKLLVSMNLDSWKLGMVEDVVGQYHVTIGRVLRYMDRQLRNREQWKHRPSVDTVLTTWRDYRESAEFLGSDMSKTAILMPDKLKERHDVVSARATEIRKAKEDERNREWVHRRDAMIREASEGPVGRFAEGYEKNGLCLVLPKAEADFINEGQKLNHCVGNGEYAKRHAEGERMIFFVRRVDDREKPYYTAEINVVSHRVVQLYGFGDRSATPDVRQFVEGFVLAMGRWNGYQGAEVEESMRVAG